jgi:DNA-binding transcriptional ArsR family regulator
MDAPPPAGRQPPAGEPPDESLPSVAVAMFQDRQRLDQARRALEDAGDVQAWSVRFGLLADLNRLRILLALHRAPGITVGDLASVVGMTDNATSQALSALRMAGVLTAVRDGRFRRWSIADPAVHDILHGVGASHSTLHPDH